MKLNDKLERLKEIDECMEVINKHGDYMGLAKGMTAYAYKAKELMYKDDIVEEDIDYINWVIRFLKSYTAQINHAIDTLNGKDTGVKPEPIDLSLYYGWRPRRGDI